MRIGIDLDGTICNTSEIVNELALKYAKKNNLDYEKIFDNKEIKNDFYLENTIDIFTKVTIKENASEVINRLKEKGHEIYIITARSNDFIPTEIDVMEPTNNWLNKHSIHIDKLIINSYGQEKAKACKDNKIDLMIDDDLYNYQIINDFGIKCLLFDDKKRYNESNRVTNWLEVERYIERNE